MLYIRILYLLITGVFLYLTVTDTSVLHFLGIVRTFPYLFVATIVLLSARYTLSWVQKGIFISFILLLGAFIYYVGLLSGIGCVDAGDPCVNEIKNHLNVSMLFFLVSAGILAFSRQRTSKKS